MSAPRVDAMLTALEAYQLAKLDLEDAERRLDRDRSPEAVHAHLTACESTIAARLGLYSMLVGIGWQPPSDVAAELELDAITARVPVGAAENSLGGRVLTAGR